MKIGDKHPHKYQFPLKRKDIKDSDRVYLETLHLSNWDREYYELWRYRYAELPHDESILDLCEAWNAPVTIDEEEHKYQMFVDGDLDKVEQIVRHPEFFTKHQWSILSKFIDGDGYQKIADDLRLTEADVYCTISRCARKIGFLMKTRNCKQCGIEFYSAVDKQEFCTLKCGKRWRRAQNNHRRQSDEIYNNVSKMLHFGKL